MTESVTNKAVKGCTCTMREVQDLLLSLLLPVTKAGICLLIRVETVGAQES